MKSKKKDFAALAAKLGDEGTGTKKSYEDSRFWKYQADEKGNYSGVIRFLPTADTDDMPYVKTFAHFFKSEIGKWYIADCPTTVKENCPVCEENTRYLEGFGGWQSAPETAKAFVRNRKRNQSYTANIYVVKDPANPDNEGKVFLFKYGYRIQEKILGSISPEFDDETPIDPFDFWGGANFKLKVRKLDGQTSYDKSEFDSPSQLLEDESEMEILWGKQHKLTEFVDPAKFESYEKLSEKLNRALGKNANASEPTTAEALSKTKTSPPKKVERVVEEVQDDDDDDDTLDFFKNLADG
jgi:hypothetical protein